MTRRNSIHRGAILLGFGRAWLSMTALFLSGFLLPVGGPLLMVLTPQPGLRLRQAFGPAAVVGLVGVVAVTIGLVSGERGGVLFLVSFGLLTLLLPPLLERNWSIEVTVGLAAAMLATAILGAALSVATPTQLLAAIHTGLEQVRSEAVQVYERAGLAPEVARQLDDGSRRLIDILLRLTPAMLLLSLAVAVLGNLAVLRRRERAQGLVPVFGDLTRWKCPAELVWVLIASGYGMFLPEGPLALLAANVFTVFLAVYFFQGLAIAQFYMRRWHSPFWVNGLVYVFIFAEWLVATGVTVVGVFDQWADFRRLNPRPAEKD